MAVMLTAASVHGCAFANGRYQNIAISSNVPAAIRVDGSHVGSTRGSVPLVTRVRRSRSHFVSAEADGHEGETASLQTELSMLGVLDIVGGFLIFVPWITLLTGHAFELEPDHVRFELRRAPTPTDEAGPQIPEVEPQPPSS
jgi:hypothetical protein